MRRTILAALTALAVLPALAFASAPRAARYEAYPAVGWQKLDEAEQKRLTRIAYGGKDYDSMMQAFQTSGGRYPRYQYDWRGISHPCLSRLLPEVVFYRRAEWDNASTAGWQNSVVAVHNGLFYDIRSFNKLLTDVGYKFDTSEIPAVAKIAVLWTLVERQAGLRYRDHRLPGDPQPDSAALATAIPAVTFRKIERRPISVLVEVDIAGKTSEVELGVRPGGYMPEGMTLDGKQWGPFFNHPSLCPTTPPAPQK